MEKTQLMSNVETVAGLYESFEAGDIDAVVQTWAPDIELSEAEGIGGRTLHGADEILEDVFTGLATEWTNVSVTPERFVDGGDTVVALITWSGTNVETGKSTAFRGAHVFDFEDGKIVRWISFSDTALFNAAMDA